ncbi:putative glutamate receptor 2 [Apostichopus japonicus]|uniref:Putative glutamate receptor 2 n=1 Tax=Stichopus japonicus TaxID=307972 RepID=A0A2G8JV64_STIJA|nr:putative glutamate receptor 2 [Apostichopus japonicus]
MSRGQYGSLDLSTGEWNGMIRDLIDGDADVAIGALTEMSAREADIDFTIPWYRNQIKLLILHPSWSFEYPFSIVYPMHLTAWFTLLAGFIMVCALVALLGHFSPYEWRRRAERGEATEEESQTFKLHSRSTVLVTEDLVRFLFWFTLCIVFIYAFNLNSVFKFSKTAIRVKDTHDLLFQDIINFGAVRFSPSYDFYRYNEGQYRQVFDRMLNSDQNLLEDRLEDAVYRIRRQWDARYAIVGEERILQYAADRKPCRLFITGKTLGRIAFSMATPSGSPLRDQLSYAIRLLQERGEIDKILEMSFSDNLRCSGDSIWENETKKSFTIHDLQGLYYLLFIGMAGSAIIFVIEWLVNALLFGNGWQRRSAGRTQSRPTQNQAFVKSGQGKDDNRDWL